MNADIQNLRDCPGKSDRTVHLLNEKEAINQ